MPEPIRSAEILAVGSELTNGWTRDTNSGDLARELTELGVHVHRTTALPDDLELVADSFRRAMATADLVVSTGGLGPTPDDLTREAIAAATGLAPGASGNATLTKTSSGWRIELDATGLPRLDNGRFYEAWLKNPAGVLVPVGTFNEGRKVTLWAGVSPEGFTALSVTREEADGNQASSGRKVLVAKIPS